MRKTIYTALILFFAHSAIAQSDTFQLVSNIYPAESSSAGITRSVFDIDKVRGLSVAVVQSNGAEGNTVSISGRLGSGNSRRLYKTTITQDELVRLQEVVDNLITDNYKRQTNDPKVCCFSAEGGFTVTTGYTSEFLSDKVNCFLTLQLQSGESRSKAYLGKSDLEKLKKVLSEANTKLKGL
ncbi:hypothetical protein LT679_18325 [Mucilaginibacter roseus]|uniref:DUF4252 domain-containing protein n=1 Tax=Mucilaginibacter roseus TaxID=1528868 RepID=A0ABS8U626_9SPHI|nr:hypothetical protein [Mucilaginibacter roseus]MCD8742573.1 hypothetical protein [Mucilaginibacter roseus]